MTTSISAEQVRMIELLEDPVYAQWLDKVPDLGVTHCYSGRPWRVWGRRELHSNWGRRDFKTYEKALKFFRKVVDAGFWDASLTSKIKPFAPPIVRDKSLGLVKVKQHGIVTMVGKKRWHIPGVVGQSEHHRWCPHCRRPTIFAQFSQHHSFTSPPLTSVKRCAVCGIAVTTLKEYK